MLPRRFRRHAARGGRVRRALGTHLTRFYLIRHGHTAAIDQHLAGRAEGTGLTGEGQRQVARMVAAMHGVPLTAVVASPLERTRQTAEPLARDHGLDVTVAPRFNEIDFGSWTGATFADSTPTRGGAATTPRARSPRRRAAS